MRVALLISCITMISAANLSPASAQAPETVLVRDVITSAFYARTGGDCSAQGNCRQRSFVTAPYFQDGFNFAKHRAQPVLAALPGLERKGGSWSWELKLPPGYRLCKFLSRRVHAIPGAVVILSRSFDGIKVFAWLPSDISFYEQRSEIIDLSIDGVREDLFAAAEAKRKCGGPRTTTLLTPDYGQGASNYLALRTDTRWNALFRPVVDVEQLRLPKMKATDMNWPHAPPYANGEVVRGNTD